MSLKKKKEECAEALEGIRAQLGTTHDELRALVDKMMPLIGRTSHAIEVLTEAIDVLSEEV